MSANPRQVMIDSQLRPQGVNDRAILAAFAAIPREDYVPEGMKDVAYRDRSVPLGDGRFMIPAAALGAMLQALGKCDKKNALVVGPGADYAAALLDYLGYEVTALDGAKGDIAKGHKKGAPYDAILLLGAAEERPEELIKQLAEGGRIVMGRADRGVTRLAAGTKAGGAVALDDFADAQLPLVEEFARKPAFSF
ncbi:protein-L-isoaspartate O-methyltransferase family protein [Sphingomicrobium flavum]|uniref:protein-L-isoaspartate O-methyltransferase family protein n=1 Tax=Sphingomicrobium flavum TaxID=1229164 RepID=UPI0021ADA380|nr:protein-L-isoaspartate O-methyltransferase [Sphingomicrobium flavum]